MGFLRKEIIQAKQQIPRPAEGHLVTGSGIQQSPELLRRLLSSSAWHAADSTNLDASLEPEEIVQAKQRIRT